CHPGQALQIFRWLWKKPIFTLDFSVVRKSSHVTVNWSCHRSPLTIPKVKIPEDTLRQVVGAVRIEVNNFLGMLRDVASGRDLKKFLAMRLAMIEFKKKYAIFDAKVLSKIPKGPLKGKKNA
ncbi:reticulon-like protein B1, partial [Tanacetum coccineum]